jgi:hypothetical protein
LSFLSNSYSPPIVVLWLLLHQLDRIYVVSEITFGELCQFYL